MRFVSFESGSREGIGIEIDGEIRGRTADEPDFPGTLDQLLQREENLNEVGRQLANGREFAVSDLAFRPVVSRPRKIICIGLNYADHSAETGYAPPTYPTVFVRFATTLIGHGGAIIRPASSIELDYEGEIAAIIGKGGRHIPEAEGLDHIAGYSLFNDASLRDYQFKSPQWTMGKNFDATGALGPAFVTADALPPGCRGLRLRTRLNGVTVQDGSVDDMIFPMARIVSILSEVFTLQPGDVIATGTPAGVGMGRDPKLWMKAGDVVEIEMDGLGTLRNPVIDG